LSASVLAAAIELAGMLIEPGSFLPKQPTRWPFIIRSRTAAG